jgi:hypothetical protein
MANPTHEHKHGPNCGHRGIKHGDHVDYMHDGHLHSPDGKECSIPVDAKNPDRCTPNHACAVHANGSHKHSPGCGHPAVPHGDHIDYVVEGHLHHEHNGHCDDHGPVQVV